MTKPNVNRRPRGGQHATLTEAEYRALIQKFVDAARKEQLIAKRLAEEARLRFGANIDVPKETE